MTYAVKQIKMTQIFGNLMSSQYDLTTYIGRLRHFVDITNPLNLFASAEREEFAKNKVLAYQKGLVDPTISKSEYWELANLYKATFHPDTNEKIFLPFRMSSYTPTNIPVVALMLIPNMNWMGIVGSQWLNQSANVGFNYFNSNKSSPLSNKDIYMGYAGAVGVSCAIALGLNQLKKSGRIPLGITPYFTFFAVSMASTSNLLLMRRKELVNGIAVYDENGNALGTSKVAAKIAIGKTALSRCLASVPALVLPPTIVTIMQNRKLFKMHQQILWRTMLVNCTLVGASFLVGLPVCLALFDQTCRVDPTTLEPLIDEQFKILKSKGFVEFNRGL